MAKKFRLKNGAEISIRLLEKSDGDKYYDFFSRLAPEDILFLKDDVTDKKLIESWVNNINHDLVIPLVAEIDGKIIGAASLHRKKEKWSFHVGEIRIVIDRNFRRSGLASAMAREIFFIALKTNLEKLMVQMLEAQDSAIALFEKLGFVQEVRLKGHAKDTTGKKQDIIIMTNDVEVLWQKVEHVDDEISSPRIQED